VWLEHGGEVLTVYAHLSELRVRTGDGVPGRSVIGLSGMTGDATAPHLHFELWRWGRERDPVPPRGGPPCRARLSRAGARGSPRSGAAGSRTGPRRSRSPPP